MNEDTKPFRDVPERKGAVDLFPCWWSMHEAHRECADLPPIHDDELVFHFMGSGASCMVFAKDIRAMVAALKLPLMPQPDQVTDEEVADAIESEFSQTHAWPEGDANIVRAFLKHYKGKSAYDNADDL